MRHPGLPHITLAPALHRAPLIASAEEVCTRHECLHPQSELVGWVHFAELTLTPTLHVAVGARTRG